jgi:hypothetical protein
MQIYQGRIGLLCTLNQFEAPSIGDYPKGRKLSDLTAQLWRPGTPSQELSPVINRKVMYYLPL